jgi:high-affinity iron transporter
MSTFLRHLASVVAAISFMLAAAPTRAANPADSPDVLNLLHMLDYIGVDYPGAVQDGTVISASEYQEQAEFAAEISAVLTRLKAEPELLNQSEAVQQAIRQVAPAAVVRQKTLALSQALMIAYPVTLAPKQAPMVAAATALFQQECSGCHGAGGAGDGPTAAGMAPAPTNFLDPARQQQRSVFALYNTLNSGVAGTAMPGFAHLHDEQRWALAFYVSQLIYAQDQRQRGEQLWSGKSRSARSLPDLQALTRVEPMAMERDHGADGIAVLAYLRAHPEALSSRRDTLLVASTQLKASVDAYARGNVDEASRLAVSAYLDGFELAEANLATADSALMLQIEQAMIGYRNLLKSGVPPAEVAKAEQGIQAQLAQARQRLQGAAQSSAGSFVGSFVILAREGLEAILVLAAMFAFLRRTERKDALPYVHAGWIVALVLGVATWAASNWLIEISGASRELTEAFTALLAAVILLSVGLWLHNKSYSNRWAHYVSGKMQGSLAVGRPWGLTLLAFIAVYREVFETVLFYRALWSQGDHLAIVLGLLAAALALLALTWAIFALSAKLPLKQFFGWSSGLIMVLAVIFTGKGVAALQEAGLLSAASVHFVRIPVLGIYPNAQGLILQLLVLSLVLGGFAWNHLQARRSPTQA